MMKRLFALLLTGVIGLSLLAGCGQTETDSPASTTSTTSTTGTSVTTTTTATSAEAEQVEPSSTTESTTTTAPTQTEETTADTTGETTTTTATTTQKQTTTQKTAATTTKKTTTTPKTTTKKTTTTTTTEKVTTTTAPDPNRVLINGKAYAVGDTVRYTIYVKTTKNYGTVTVGVRCLQKGLEIPNGTAQKQNQYIMKNIGMGRLGTTPEDTVGQNGFRMSANKGFALDSSVAGSAGLLWFYETTNYDYSTQAYREIDCSKGVALFSIDLKVTKPGEYTVGCMEYPNKSRSDLTVWGEFS